MSKALTWKEKLKDRMPADWREKSTFLKPRSSCASKVKLTRRFSLRLDSAGGFMDSATITGRGTTGKESRSLNYPRTV